MVRVCDVLCDSGIQLHELEEGWGEVGGRLECGRREGRWEQMSKEKGSPVYDGGCNARGKPGGKMRMEVYKYNG